MHYPCFCTGKKKLIPLSLFNSPESSFSKLLRKNRNGLLVLGFMKNKGHPSGYLITVCMEINIP